MVSDTETKDLKPRRRSNSNEIKWAERVVQISRVTKVVKGGKKIKLSCNCCYW
jgi:ribosomal protein S5